MMSKRGGPTTHGRFPDASGGCEQCSFFSVAPGPKHSLEAPGMRSRFDRFNPLGRLDVSGALSVPETRRGHCCSTQVQVAQSTRLGTTALQP